MYCQQVKNVCNSTDHLLRRLLPLSLLAVTVGCSDQQPSSVAPDNDKQEAIVSQVAASEGNESVPSEPTEIPVWESWPTPRLAFMLTTEMHGYFEPCGCTSNQLGGMSRRADLLKKLTDSGWTVRGLDVGGLSRRSVRQSQIKFETTLAALRQLNYVAIGLGPEELRLQPDFLLSQHIVDGKTPLYFLGANLEFYGIADLGTPLRSHIFEVQGIKVGVTSVMSKELQAEVLPHPDIAWKEPEPILKDVLASFDEQQVELKVLLSQSSVEESKELAQKFPAFQIVITAEGTGDPDPKAPPEQVGDTLVIQAGRKGKYVGVLGYYPDNEQKPFDYKLVSLERDAFNDTPAMVDLMQGYQTRLKEEQTVLVDGIAAPHPSGATFVGASKCGECHTEALAIWQDTGHAHALESLDPSNKRLGHERLNGINRSYDPECLACHVAGWDPQEYIRFQSGFLNEEFAQTEEERTLHSLLAGSQCENCHGPGSRHIELVEADDLEAAKTQVRVTLEQAKKGLCEKCHDADNSPKFEFDEYWEKVKHYGLE